MRIVADTAACEGHANCLVIAPALFDLDSDDRVVVLHEEVNDRHQEGAEAAARACPAGALRLT